MITGGAGFIGSNYLEKVCSQYPDDNFICFDSLTYAVSLGNIQDLLGRGNFSFVIADIRNREEVMNAIEVYHIDSIINFAAESHVDNSINDPGVVYDTNVNGTVTLLEAFRQSGCQGRYLQISTDEVYGPHKGSEPACDEKAKLAPTSPYAASKAMADLAVLSYAKTYSMDCLIIRLSNNYGPKQHVEKFIPKVITNALQNTEIPIYGTGEQTRNWLYVGDACNAIDSVFRKGKSRNIYNVCSWPDENKPESRQHSNNEIASYILGELGKSPSLLVHVDDRINHDISYQITSKKIRTELGFKEETEFETGIRNTIEYYREIN